MFHYDAKQDTYRKFFDVVRDAIANDVLCAEIGGDVDVVLGSDDEKALVNAFSAAFPSAGHVFCSSHLEEIVRRYLADDIGIPVADRNQDTCTFSTRQFHLMSIMYF